MCLVRTISRKDFRERVKEVRMVLDVKAIPPRVGYYLAGFADGEGSFNVSFRPRNDYSAPWKVSMCFNISQKDKVILALYKRWLHCGTLRGRPDGVWYYEVNNFNAIVENVMPFFNRFQFMSAKKKRDYAKFKQIAKMIQEGRHQSKDGILEIMKIRRDMNDGGKRRYSEEQIRDRLSHEESSEAIRQAFPEREER
jgi:hypothetical protein